MCGIVGFISKKREDDILEDMLKVQAHRGPDDRGIFVEKVSQKYVHLGHNRLSIQDISYHGHQPFISACGMYVLVFNGEIYNFKSLKKTLEDLGHRFVSHSDTEVILYAYKAWGMACLDKFIGMFAFTLLDKSTQKMYLVRDRAGVKPLYYYDDNTSFLFASELKSLHQHQGFKKALNKDALTSYFQMGYIPSPYTIFKHTYKLEAGFYLVYDLKDNSHEKVQYWSVDACYRKEKFDKSEAETLDDLEALLYDAVDLRMVSDVPVGVFLSGGYDSSMVTALLSQKHKDLHTFTIGFEQKQYNEAQHAQSIAKYFATKHTQKYMTNKEMLSMVETLPFHYDEPFGDSSAIPTMLLSQLAQKEVTVALSADGGDEAFCGYSKYFFLAKFSKVFNSKFQKKILQNMVNTISPSVVEHVNDSLPKQLRQSNMRDKYQKFQRAINRDSFEAMFLEASSPVSPHDVKNFLKYTEDKAYLSKFKMHDNKHLVDEMMRIDYQTFMSDDVLTKVDRATMSVGLEGREPLLDHRIVEYMARVPVALKYKDKQGKYLLRQILYKHIPPSLIDKPKSGFQVPLQSWLEHELKPLVAKYLDTNKIDDEIFDVEEIERMKKELFLGKPDDINKIWFILMYEMWKEKWF